MSAFLVFMGWVGGACVAASFAAPGVQALIVPGVIATAAAAYFAGVDGK